MRDSLKKIILVDYIHNWRITLEDQSYKRST